MPCYAALQNTATQKRRLHMLTIAILFLVSTIALGVLHMLDHRR
jgi:hypothetical protein